MYRHSSHSSASELHGARAPTTRPRLHTLATTVGCALAMTVGVAALPVAGAALPGTRPSHAKPAQLLASPKQYFHRFIVKYRGGSSEQRDSGMRQQALDVAMSRTGIVEKSASRAGTQRRAPRISSLRRLATGADAIAVERKLTVAETAALLRALRSDKQVEYAQIDRLKRPTYVPNDPMWAVQWDLSQPTVGINAPAAWNITRGARVVVAVIDTGISNHPDLQPNIIPGYDFISDATIARDGNGRDADPTDQGDWNTDEAECEVSDSSWHGTHVAGTIGALAGNALGVAGVAHGAKVMPLRVLGQCGGYTSDISDAIIWAAGGSVAGVPANTRPAKVLNLSLGGGGPCSVDEQVAVDTAIARGATVVVAAGNESADVSTSSPANCEGVVAVAATGRSGALAGFSNYGSAVTLGAPGVDIYSTANNGTTIATTPSYPAYSGTSMAAPHVSGVVALMQSAAPRLRTPAHIKTMLQETATRYPAACNGCGSGILNALTAVRLAVRGLPRTLVNNVAIPVTGAAGSALRYRIAVPVEARNLRVSLSGGSGNPDLYVRYAAEPTTTAYTCRPYQAAGIAEVCTRAMPAVGFWNVNVVGRSAYTRAILRASYNMPVTLENNVAVTGLSASTGTTLRYRINVPYGAKNLSINTSGFTGNADLYLRHGTTAGATAYDCRPALGAGVPESCTVAAPAWGDWYISLLPRNSYSGLTLLARYAVPTPRTYQNTTDYQIRDDTTVNSPIRTANRNGNASPTMQVGVVIRHTWVGDLVIELVGPDGTAYMISNQGFGDQVDLLQTFTIDASSSPASGLWKLRVTDNGPGDIGKIDSWTLTF